MNAKSLLWSEIFLFLAVLMVIFVPRPRIVRLLPYGLTGGFGLSVLLLWFLVPIFRFWQFSDPGIFSVRGIPLFISLAWTPVEVAYAHFLYRSSYKYVYYGFWAGMSLGSSLFTQGLVYIGYLKFINWNFYHTLAISLFLHGVLTHYLARVQLLGRAVRETEES